MKIIFDLDGTLALIDHRVHFLNREKKDWRAFYAACDRDQPCHPIIRTMLALYTTGADVEIWTGRSMEVFDKTKPGLRDKAPGLSRSRCGKKVTTVPIPFSRKNG
jgi:hypothetical protein